MAYVPESTQLLLTLHVLQFHVPAQQPRRRLPYDTFEYVQLGLVFVHSHTC